jgi:putative ABC transport system permease protein
MRWTRRSEHDFADEVQAHLELEIARLRAEGLSADEARRRARHSFGSVTAAHERFQESRRLLWLDHLSQDLRGAVRSLTRYPIAALVAVISLGVGIGATTATLTIRNAVFRKPPPSYAQPDQLSKIQVVRADGPNLPIGGDVPGALYFSWRDTFGPAIAAATSSKGVRDVRTTERTDAVPVRAVTPNFFSVLGVGPELGRLFSDAAANRADPARAVLSHRLWQQLFDGQAYVVGRVVWIDNHPHTIIGVLPPRFWFSDMSSPIWTLLDSQALSSDDGLHVIVRRPPATTPATLTERLQAGLAGYASRLPAADRQLRLRVSSVEGTPVGDQVSIVLPYVLAVSVLLTALIACANVAILMIAQWTAREHEIAIRASLGASRARIVRALLAESMVIAMGGGALGVCATFALRGLLVRRLAVDLTFFDLSIDPRVLLQSAIVTLLAGIVSGLAPALYESRRLQVNPLSATGTSDRVRQRWRHALVVLEITVTVALLVVTSAMISGYQRTMRAQMGFHTRPLMSARVENPRGVPTARMLDALSRVRGVAAVAASTSIPYTAVGPLQRVAADATGSKVAMAERAAISAGFFSALDVPLRAGHAFTRQDSASTHTAIVNETLAKRLFGGRDPVGSRIWVAQAAYEIVGVVADYSNHPFQFEDFNAKIFLPLPDDSRDTTRQSFLIRAQGDPGPLIQTVRREVRDAAAGSVVTSAYTFDQILAVMGQEMLVGVAPLVPLIAIGMLLTSAGIYGVLAFSIARRSRELAVRVAIGATGGDVIRLVTAHSFRLVAGGSAVGLAVTFGLTRIVRASGGAGTPFDPSWPIFAIPVLMIAGIGALATWIPSRRALRINPAVLLRTS